MKWLGTETSDKWAARWATRSSVNGEIMSARQSNHLSVKDLSRRDKNERPKTEEEEEEEEEGCKTFLRDCNSRPDSCHGGRWQFSFHLPAARRTTINLFFCLKAFRFWLSLPQQKWRIQNSIWISFQSNIRAITEHCGAISEHFQSSFDNFPFSCRYHHKTKWNSTGSIVLNLAPLDGSVEYCGGCEALAKRGNVVALPSPFLRSIPGGWRPDAFFLANRRKQRRNSKTPSNYTHTHTHTQKINKLGEIR